MGESIERFVPVGKGSLVDDAPGWGREGNDRESKTATEGPVCWKCHGTGQKKKKKSKKRPRNEDEETTKCTVCQGTGRVAPKKQEALALQNRPGEITRVRACPSGWKARGPLPRALEQEEPTPNQREAIRLVRLAETGNDEVPIDLEESTCAFDKSQPLPVWLPRKGEQLCNLAGRYRILQRVASHRWTTDDLVTSYMAGLVLGDGANKPNLRYLDLGCGNGSVLLMTTWQLLCARRSSNTTSSKATLTCTGIEARQEAVQLARRSIAFDVGDSADIHIRVHHGDFRSILDTLIQDSSSRFDLVTGTPPYFRVDFKVEKKSNDDDDKQVQQAVIQQGGMPTCKQSAPARCEFRGGIEAYCKAASRAMHRESLFCVCENWLNNDRVYGGAKDAGLVVEQVLPVKGRTGKPCPLFAVYAMRKREFFDVSSAIPETKTLDCLSVRDDKGNWTEGYQKVLEVMSIPVVL